mmetsp:Transcript_18361/g.41907  ORF Transcript_18361/g.41907 Transcript_18361/m.41907 type:complete len:443 (+) Transcript_18361:350-1678(+)
MEKADPDDLSVELTTFDEEAELSSSMLESEASHHQQHQEYAISGPSGSTTPALQAPVSSSGEQATTTRSNATATNKSPSLPTSLLEEIHQLPKEIRNIIAGGFAGMIAKSIVAPFDRIKILYQVSSAEFQIRKIPAIARRIVHEEGISALWKGNTATLIRVFPYSGIQFMVFDRCKTYILREQERNFLREKKINPSTPKPNWGLSPLESLFAGMAAGAISVVATYPLDLTRAQLAVLKMKKGASSSSNVGFAAALLNNYRDRGAVGLFRGITPTLMGILPYSGLAFSFNEQAKRKIQRMTGRDLTTIERMQCGALSGLFAQTVTYPLEVTRRRMQTIGIVATSGKDAAVEVVGKAVTQSGKNSTVIAATRAIAPDHPPSMSSIVKDLYREQGTRGFFKGVTLNWFKGPIAFSISFTCFDIIQSSMATDAERELQFQRRMSRR